MEALACGLQRDLAAVNIPNRGAIPNLPGDMVVEIPATADKKGLHRCPMEPLPEAIAAMIRLQGSIHKLLVEAYAEGSKTKLLQALLLDRVIQFSGGIARKPMRLLRRFAPRNDSKKAAAVIARDEVPKQSHPLITLPILSKTE